MQVATVLALLGFVGVSFCAAVGAVFYRPGEWYEHLNQPSWRPPNRFFAPVWTILYLLIGVSGWLVWQQGGFWVAALPLGVFGLNLVLNALWSPLFFGLHRIDLGLADIALVWLTIVAAIILFWPIQYVAALLLVPYLMWVSFATALNFDIWRRNR
jgi:benzodiazapine receptor